MGKAIKATPFRDVEGKILPLRRGRTGRSTERWWTIATLAARLLLGLAVVVAAFSKIATPGISRADIAAYHLLPAILVGPVAGALPWLEALVALYLLVGLFLRPTAIAAAALLVLFTAALVVGLAHGDTGHGCSCLSRSGLIGVLPPTRWPAGDATIVVRCRAQPPM